MVLKSAKDSNDVQSRYAVLCAKSCVKDSQPTYNDIVTGDQEDM